MTTPQDSLPKLKDWKPTHFDAPGIGSDSRENWLVLPILYHPKLDDLISESNFYRAEEILSQTDPSKTTWESHYFKHWISDFKILIVSPNSQACEIATRIAIGISNYSILDEMDYSERLHNMIYSRYWDNMQDRICVLKDCNLSIFAARREWIPKELYKILSDSHR